MSTLGNSTKSSEHIQLSIVIPVYNDVESLPILRDEFRRALPEEFRYELIFVNDSPTRGETYRTIDLLSKYPEVKAVHLSRNFGQHVAFAAGIANSSGSHILIMDADLQYAPKDCLRLLEVALREQSDVVLSTISKRRQPFFKKVITKVFYNLMILLGTPVTRDDLGSVFLLSRHVANGLARMADRHRFTIEMILWLTMDVSYCHLTHSDRKYGKSGYTFSKLVRHAINGITSFSSKPLYISLLCSGVFGLIAICGVIYLLVQILYFGKAYAAGWASVTVLILTCTSIILASLGVLGIYVGRMFESTKGRPLYFVHGKDRSIKLFEDL